MKQVSTFLSKTVWTETEDDFLRLHFIQLSQREMAIRLSRTKGEVQHRLEFLDLKLTDEQRALKKQAAGLKMQEFSNDNREDLFSEAELWYLALNYADTQNRLIAEALGRSEQSIASKASKLGLKKSEGYMVHTLYNVIIPARYSRASRDSKMQFLKTRIIAKRKKHDKQVGQRHHRN